MTFKKAHILTIATVAVLSAGAFGATRIYAQERENNPIMLFHAGNEAHMSSLVQKLADKFGLNKDEVQAVFDEERKEMESQMEGQYEERLSQLVRSGEITEEQKALIQEKHQEMKDSMKDEMEGMKDLTTEERKAQMQAKHDELESWAEEHGIDLKYLMFNVGMHKERGHGSMMFKSSDNTQLQ